MLISVFLSYFLSKISSHIVIQSAFKELMIISLFLIQFFSNLYYIFCYTDRYEALSPNVRTVLFTAQDLRRTCWSREDIGLLFTRYLMQQLLPVKVPRNITSLNQYISISLQTINDLVTSPRALEFIMEAYADTFGGYLQSYGLPLVNEAYYEGIVHIEEPISLHNVYDDFKKLLNTDGNCWARPIFISEPIKPIEPLKLTYKDNENYCKKLILNKNCDCDYLKTNENERCIDIPLPFYDDCSQPHAIAVPLKQHSLYSLTNASSRGVLSLYYETSINCLRQSSTNKKSTFSKKHHKNNNKCMENFCTKFKKWSERKVLCHLHDKTWYTAFDGVLRVIQVNEDILKHGQTNNTITAENEDTGNWFFAIVVICLIALFWLVILAFLLYRKFCGKEIDEENGCDENCPYCKGENCDDKFHIGPFSYSFLCWNKATDSQSSSEKRCACTKSYSYPGAVVSEKPSDHKLSVPRQKGMIITPIGHGEVEDE